MRGLRARTALLMTAPMACLAIASPASAGLLPGHGSTGSTPPGHGIGITGPVLGTPGPITVGPGGPTPVVPNVVCGGPSISTDITLNTDVVCSSGQSVTIDGDGITVNLNGHTISSDPSGTGLRVIGSNITVENGTITGFTTGIDNSSLNGTTYPVCSHTPNTSNTFSNLYLYGNTVDLKDEGSYGTSVLNSTFGGHGSNDQIGIQAYCSTYELVKSNTFTGYEGAGYDLGGTRNAEFVKNMLTDLNYGVLDEGQSTNNSFTNNAMNGFDTGFAQGDGFMGPNYGSANDSFIANTLNWGTVGFALGGLGINGFGASYVANNVANHMDFAGYVLAGNFDYQDPFSTNPTDPLGGPTPPNIANVIGSDIVNNVASNDQVGIFSLVSPAATVSGNSLTSDGVGMLSVAPWKDTITSNNASNNAIAGVALVTDLGGLIGGGEFPVQTVSNNTATGNGSEIGYLTGFGGLGGPLAGFLGLPNASYLATGMIADYSQYGGGNVAWGNAQFNCLNITCSSQHGNGGGFVHHAELNRLRKLLPHSAKVLAVLKRLRHVKASRFHTIHKPAQLRWHA